MSEEQLHEAGSDLTGGGTVVATQVAPAKPRPRQKPKYLPPFKVLLHNDEVNTFDHVIEAVVRLAGLPLEEAMIKTIEAHETGVALLLVTHMERAELLTDQFASLSISATFEAA